jgi:glycosyltransferase involved in cell wall biosynthesis
MRCPTLTELPPPPPGKTGWPWTEESPQLNDAMPDGSPWPTISIVTPSLNQAQFIEETIRSVLLQGYPELEYIIIDGGSIDQSVDIITQYDRWITHWVSEPDRGQSNAINKGVKASCGDIITWINSDDAYHPEAFSAVALCLYKGGKLSHKIVFSNCDFIDESGRFLYRFIPEPFSRNKLIKYWEAYFIPQPTVFLPGPIFKANPLNESLTYVMDWDLWLRLSERYEYQYINRTLAKFRNHGSSKWGTANHLFVEEQKTIVHCYHKNLIEELLFHVKYDVWKIRLLYHRVVRIYFLKLLHRLVGIRIYSELRHLKKSYLSMLSKKR